MNLNICRNNAKYYDHYDPIENRKCNSQDDWEDITNQQVYTTGSCSDDEWEAEDIDAIMRERHPELFSESKNQEDDLSDDSDDEQSNQYEYRVESELQTPAYTERCVLVGGGKDKKKNYRKNKPQKTVVMMKPKVPTVPRNLRGNDIMPPYVEKALNFIDPNCQVAAPTQSFVVKAFKINSLYDPDPALLSSGYAGFAQLMVFYEFYRVDEIEVIWKTTNNESFAINVGFVFSQRDLTGTITSRQLALDNLENGISTGIDTLQQRNGGRSDGKYRRRIACAALLGNPALYEGDISYTGTASTDPSDLLWVNLIVTSPANLTLLLNGAVGTLRLRAHSRLFGRIVLDDTLFQQKMLARATLEQLKEELVRRSLADQDTVLDRRKSLQ